MTAQLPHSRAFDYQQAFSRNLGWVTEAEQQLLRGKRVAIAGLGGVGGIHLLIINLIHSRERCKFLFVGQTQL